MQVEGKAKFHLPLINYVVQESKLLLFIPMLRLSQWAPSRIPVLSPCDPRVISFHWVLALKMHILNSSFWVFLGRRKSPWQIWGVDFGPGIFFGCSDVFLAARGLRGRFESQIYFLKIDNELLEFPYNSVLLYGVATRRGQLSLLSLPLSDTDIEINLKNE